MITVQTDIYNVDFDLQVRRMHIVLLLSSRVSADQD